MKKTLNATGLRLICCTAKSIIHLTGHVEITGFIGTSREEK